MVDEREVEIDIDQIETDEWMKAFADTYREHGPERAAYLLRALQQKAVDDGSLFQQLSLPRIEIPYRSHARSKCPAICSWSVESVR